jgi:nucleoporin POM152
MIVPLPLEYLFLTACSSALLNPNRDAFCLGGAIHQINLPIQINQTNPILIEILRVDLDSSETEVVTINSKSLKSLRKAALKAQNPRDASSPLLLHHPIKKPGQYTLQKIIDESNLEVRPRISNVVVVQCPSARILHTTGNKCRGELSDIAFEVIGTPPLRVKYRKTVNDIPVESSFQSIQPDDFISPLSRQVSGTITKFGDSDASWARAQRVVVPVNETLFNSGRWLYSIDEVQDAVGNVLSYVTNSEDYEQPKSKITDQQQLFAVHERPKISLRGYSEQGCDSQHPLKVAKGDSHKLPVKFESDGKGEIVDTRHIVEYLFTPENALSPSGEHDMDNQQIHRHVFKNTYDSLLIGESGLYSLKSVATEFCTGDVMEPASCLLQNPPEPAVSFVATNLTDRCAGNPVGLSLTMDFAGTPPFEVHYLIRKKGSGRDQKQTFKVAGHRGQLELTPPDAGHYTYIFSHVDDRHYRAKKLDETVEQTVKPSASAHFETSSPSGPLCLSEDVAFNVRLGGEGPWNLEYELVHNGKKKKSKVEGITDDRYLIKTDPLESGGDYSLALTSVEAGGCKEYSKEEVTFSVRHQRPKASFGVIDGKRNIHTLEGKQLRLPLRLTGERPWTIEYQNKDVGSALVIPQVAYSENFMLEIKERGTYELKSIRDSACSGVIDQEANQFKVEWIQRPTLLITDSPTVDNVHGKFIKKEVCEGDEDFVELSFTGNCLDPDT